MVASLLGETVTLTVSHFDWSLATPAQVTLYTTTFTVVSGNELTNQTISYVGSTSVGSEIWTRNETFDLTVNVEGDTFYYFYNGSANTYGPSGLRLDFTSIADESISAVTGVTETAGTESGVFNSPTPSYTSTSVTMVPAPLGGGVSGEQTVQATFTAAGPPNTAPTVSNAPSDLTVTEDTRSNLSLGTMAFADADGDNLTVTLTVSSGILNLFGTSGYVLTASGDGTSQVTLSGSAAAINSFLDVASNVRYTGAANVNGNNAATLTVSASDGNGGSLASNPVINLDITAVNDAPTVSGAPTDVTAVEDVASNIDLSAMSFADIEGDTLTVTLTASAGTLAASASGGVAVANSGTGALTLTGTTTALNTYLDTLSNVKYTGAANANGNDAATITVSASDGNGGSLASNPVINVDITAVNDAPTASGAPTDVTATEDVASNIDLSAMSFADVEGDTLTVTLTASAGTLAASASGGVAVANSGTGALELTGTAAALTSFLDTLGNVKYTGAANANGNDAATITVSASDGNGGSLASDPVINVDITAVNDAPTVSGAPTDVAATEDVASNIDLSAMSFDDVDGDALTVVLQASAGTLTGSSGGGVIVSGSGSDSLYLSGTAAAINTFLDTAGNVQYTGALNANGNDAATITVSASDGNGGSLAADPVINVDITAVNDAPTLTGTPAGVVVPEDSRTAFNVTDFDFGDAENDFISVTIRATYGEVYVNGSVGSQLTIIGFESDLDTYFDTAIVEYVPVSNASGPGIDTITITAVDSYDALTPPKTISVSVIAVNDAPTVSGAPTDVTATEDVASNIDLSAMSFADIEGDTLTVTLTASAGTLAASASGGVAVANSGTGALTLTGTTTALNTYLDTLSNVKYTGAANANGNDAATITVSASDGNGGSLAADPVINVDITAVNDAPTVSGAPSDVTATEDVASNIDLSAMTFADVDGDTLTVVLQASAGTLTGSSGGGVIVSGSGSNPLYLSGTAAAINTFLDTAGNVQYTGAFNVNGNDAATITVSAIDGNGGSLASDPVINVDITAVNDAPTVSGAPSDVTAVEDVASNIDLSAMSFADIEGDTLTITLTASAGTLAASAAAGVAVANSGTGALELTGTAAALNSFLDTLGNVTYTGAANANGNDTATITVSASDAGGAGFASDPVINVDITAVNDPATGAPEISGNAVRNDVLTADIGTVDDVDGISGTVSWQWLRDGVEIAGETSDTLTLTNDDVGHEITVRASFTDDFGTPEARESDPTDIVVFGGDIIIGTAGEDTLIGGTGNDLIRGLASNDWLLGAGGDDIIGGGNGKDSLFGGFGNDVLFGGYGRDFLHGQVGNDSLNGGFGNDVLLGGVGEDRLNGGVGRDLLIGGDGDDVFVFFSWSGHDWISDFAEGDTIEIRTGAESMSDLTFQQQSTGTLVSFGNVEIMVSGLSVAQVNDADNFLFT